MNVSFSADMIGNTQHIKELLSERLPLVLAKNTDFWYTNMYIVKYSEVLVLSQKWNLFLCFRYKAMYQLCFFFFLSCIRFHGSSRLSFMHRFTYSLYIQQLYCPVSFPSINTIALPPVSLTILQVTSLPSFPGLFTLLFFHLSCSYIVSPGPSYFYLIFSFPSFILNFVPFSYYSIPSIITCVTFPHFTFLPLFILSPTASLPFCHLCHFSHNHSFFTFTPQSTTIYFLVFILPQSSPSLLLG